MGRFKRRLSPAEAREFLDTRGIKNTATHKMTKHVFHWPYCARCGLVALKNKPTARALRAPCVIYE